ncbi:hypothetical protein L3X38_008789 [Prunus dulcis]|uniref:Uncharacterized protein n=1 Tax=Prunus dulcis TaxID=3755 RepID=A0AAD5F7C0_PRUDU|nr:hypothetical protein L3X38_008789 [Prunus dulcis]
MSVCTPSKRACQLPKGPRRGHVPLPSPPLTYPIMIPHFILEVRLRANDPLDEISARVKQTLQYLSNGAQIGGRVNVNFMAKVMGKSWPAS